MKRILSLLALVLMPSIAFAQSTPTSSSQLVWDQTGVATAAEAQALTYRYYPDGSSTGTALVGVTCSGTTVITCQVPFPAFTPGAHSLTVTAANIAGESLKSAPFAFTFQVVPLAPSNVRYTVK